MRAGWNSKGGQSRTRTTSSEEQAATEMGTGGVGYRVPSDNLSIPESIGLRGNNIFEKSSVRECSRGKHSDKPDCFASASGGKSRQMGQGRKFET